MLTRKRKHEQEQGGPPPPPPPRTKKRRKQRAREGDSNNNGNKPASCSPASPSVSRKQSLRTWDRVARCFEQPLRQPLEPIDPERVSLTHGVCAVEGLLGADECERVCDLTARDWAWRDPLLHDFARAQRQGTRVLVRMDEMAAVLWERVEPVVQKHFADVTPFGFNVQQGKWEAVGLNPCFRLVQYAPGDHFAVHRDAQFTPNTQLRSTLTLLVYLSDGDGTTEFLLPTEHYERVPGETPGEELERIGEDRFRKVSVQPAAGKGVLFDHDTLHRAHPPSETKFILRTDVVFACAEQPALNPATAQLEKMAKAMYTEATNRAVDGDAEGAGVLYERGLSARQAQRAPAPSSPASLFERVLGHIALNTSFLSEDDLFALGQVCKAMRAVMRVRKDALLMKDRTPQNGLAPSAPFIPRLLSRSGCKCEFQFTDHAFFDKHKAKCVRVAAMYAIALFGHPANAHSIVVNYDPQRDCALGVSIDWLLTCVFHSLPCHGSVFHVTAPSGVHPHEALNSQTHARTVGARYNARWGLTDKALLGKIGDKLAISNLRLEPEAMGSFWEDDVEDVSANDRRVVAETSKARARLCVVGPEDEVPTHPPGVPDVGGFPLARKANARAIRSANHGFRSPGFSRLVAVEGHVQECVGWGRSSPSPWQKSFVHPCFGCDNEMVVEETKGRVPFVFDNLAWDFSRADLELASVDDANDRFGFTVAQRQAGVLHASFTWQARASYDFKGRAYEGRTELQSVAVTVRGDGRVATEYSAAMTI